MGHQVNPRITLIGALDTQGDLYLAISQANTDNSTMKLFLTSLAEKLDLDRPAWRDDTIVLLDGATYHTSTDVREHFQRL